MNKTITNAILTGLCIAIAAVILPIATNAQVLRNQNRYRKADVSKLITSLESSSNTFRRDFDRALDQSPLNGTSTEDQYNREVQQYEMALNRLRREFDRRDSWWETRNDVSSVIREAQTVNNIMNTVSFRRNLERQWNQMRNDLNTLADTYDLPGLNGGGWNGGGGGGGGWNGPGNPVRPPSWAQGTFYGVAPNGTRIMLTIASNGQVTANIGGSMNYGSFERSNYLRMNEARSRVTQTRNGIRTTRTDNREVIEYSKTAWSGGGGGGPIGGGAVRPPSWAQGTFFGVAPNGTRISLTILSNGDVIAEIGGNRNQGYFLRNNMMRMNEALSRVTQTRYGIRTTRTDNGEVIDYRKAR